MEFSFEPVLKWLLTHGIRIAIIVVGGFVVMRLVRFLTRRIEKAVDDGDPTTVSEREKRAKTLSKVATQVVAIIVFVICGMMIMRELGMDIGPVIMGAGILGLAVSFGAQNLMRDIISGFFILLENHFRVGDVIRSAGVAGLVESISLRVTVLRDLEGKVHIIPNGEMSVVSNFTKGWSRCVVDIGVAYKEDVDRVMEILERIGSEMAEDPEFKPMILSPLEVLGLDQFADSAVVIKTMTQTAPLKQWAVAREFRRRVKKTFDELGIEIPFPHQTIYMGEGENKGKLVVEMKPTAPA